MIRRNRHYNGVALRNVNPQYPPTQTNQREPSLRELLVKYQRGEDISDYITMSAEKATAEQQFKNRVGKVDPLTELETIVKTETEKANQMITEDNRKRKTKTEQSIETTPENPEQKE